jgi:hypothetical protein
VMLMAIEAAAPLSQPLPKCRAFHRRSPFHG